MPPYAGAAVSHGETSRVATTANVVLIHGGNVDGPERDVWTDTLLPALCRPGELPMEMLLAGIRDADDALRTLDNLLSGRRAMREQARLPNVGPLVVILNKPFAHMPSSEVTSPHEALGLHAEFMASVRFGAMLLVLQVDLSVAQQRTTFLHLGLHLFEFHAGVRVHDLPPRQSFPSSDALMEFLRAAAREVNEDLTTRPPNSGTWARYLISVPNSAADDRMAEDLQHQLSDEFPLRTYIVTASKRGLLVSRLMALGLAAQPGPLPTTADACLQPLRLMALANAPLVLDTILVTLIDESSLVASEVAQMLGGSFIHTLEKFAAGLRAGRVRTCCCSARGRKVPLDLDWFCNVHEFFQGILPELPDSHQGEARSGDLHPHGDDVVDLLAMVPGSLRQLADAFRKRRPFFNCSGSDVEDGFIKGAQVFERGLMHFAVGTVGERMAQVKLREDESTAHEMLIAATFDA